MKKVGYRIGYRCGNNVVFINNTFYTSLEEAEKDAERLQPQYAHRGYWFHLIGNDMKGKHVWVVSYNAGVLGVYSDWGDAYRDSQDYRANDYKGVKIQEFLVG